MGSESGPEPRSGELDSWCVIFDALRVEFDDAEEVVASRMYSTTSQVWRVASGAKETRRLAAESQNRVLLNVNKAAYQETCDAPRDA